MCIRRHCDRRRKMHHIIILFSFIAQPEAPLPTHTYVGRFMDGLQWILDFQPTMPELLETRSSQQEALNYSNQHWQNWNKSVSAFSLVCKESNQNTITLPANQPTQHKEDKAAIWLVASFFICPTPVTMALVQTTCSPLLELCGGHLSKAACHFLIKQEKGRITRDTSQPH